ncbi:hypothetical protein D3C76_654400 [compost metagenome]
MPLHIGGQAKPGKAQLLFANHHIDVHFHRQGWFALFGLLADDHRVIGELDRRWRQLANGDVALGHPHFSGDGQFIALQRDFQVRGHFHFRIGFDADWQLRALEREVHHRRLAPGDIAVEAALPGLAAFPAAIELHGFTGDHRLQLQRLNLHRQLGAGHFAVTEHQIAIDQRRQQATGNRAAAIEATSQFLDHGHKRPRHRQVQATQAEGTGQRFVLRQRVDLRLYHQFPKLAANEIQVGIDALGRKRAGELEGLIREIQPLLFLAHAQRPAAGIDADHAVRAAGWQVQLHVGVEPALPGEILRQPLGEAVDGELPQVITQLRLRHQTLVFTAQTGRARRPAMGAKIDFAVRQPFQFRRPLQLPVLATGLDIAAGQASAPVALVQRTVEADGQLQLRSLQVEAQLLVLDVALTAGAQRAQ